MTETFRVGDTVSWAGVEGVVVRLTDKYAIANFPANDDLDVYFWLDGKQEAYHTEPSLKLIRREKRRVKKVMYKAVYAVNGNAYHEASLLCNTRERAIEGVHDLLGVVSVEVEFDE